MVVAHYLIEHETLLWNIELWKSDIYYLPLTLIFKQTKEVCVRSLETLLQLFKHVIKL